jgi:hypothetical protein
MGHRVQLRLWVGVAAVVALALVVLFPPWLVVRVTPQGAIPQRVEFSFLLGSGPQRVAGGMYPQRSVIKLDWLALEIAAVAAVAVVLLLLVPQWAGRRGQAGASAASRAAPAPRRTDPERIPPTEYQSSPGESFEQHAARLARVWQTEAADPAHREPERAAAPGLPTPAAGPPSAPQGGPPESPTEFQSSPGEPFDQHAERLKRVWRPRAGARGPRKPHDEDPRA